MRWRNAIHKPKPLDKIAEILLTKTKIVRMPKAKELRELELKEIEYYITDRILLIL